MSASSDRLRVLVPAFADVAAYPDATIDAYLTTAAERLNASAWRSLYTQAVIYLAAHLLASAPPTVADANGGPVTSRKAGGLAVTYAAPAGGGVTSEALRTTAPGREFLALRSALPARVGGVYGVR